MGRDPKSGRFVKGDSFIRRPRPRPIKKPTGGKKSPVIII